MTDPTAQSSPVRSTHASLSDALSQLDEAKLSRFHWLTVLTAGMGFFTDAYDLFIIGTVTVILTPIWHLSTSQLSLLNSISLLASVAGAITFGKLMDRFGRKSVYGMEVSLLTLGAILSGFAWGFWALFAFRILVGLGVGGDYATSAVITSEYSNRTHRGRLLGTVFAMQGIGLLAGPAVAAILLGSGVPHALAWRVMLALGALPAASVIYLRRRIKESPRYTLAVKGDTAATMASVAWATGKLPVANGKGVPVANSEMPAHTLGETMRMQPSSPSLASASGTKPPSAAGADTEPKAVSLFRSPFARRLVGAAGCWFLMDIAFYGNSVSSPLILKALQPHASLLQDILLAGAIFLVAALPGYWVAVGLMDRLGRRRIQWQGFLVMALAFGSIAAIPGVIHDAWAFLVLFGISYFFVEFGPNETTFLFPAEIFPSRIRGAGDGFSAAAGKLGAFLGALAVPHLLEMVHLQGVMAIMAGVSLIGALLTLATLPEPNQMSLEAASKDELPLWQATQGAPAPASEAGSDMTWQEPEKETAAWVGSSHTAVSKRSSVPC
jgi:PHS family inorganic phosphate transporter-like MFS transporter